MLELKDFQLQAALQIAERFEKYQNNIVITGTKNNPYQIPYYQSLASLTASGKTVILAKAVAEMALTQNPAPIILWISKASVVVEQSFENLSAGGKYHHLLADTQTDMLANCQKETLEEQNIPLLYFATVGTFNQKDKEEGDRSIYQSNIDIQDTSIWETIKKREYERKKRPLFIVYDEGHNLSDQQTELLLELKPEVFLIASATMRYPKRVIQEINKLKEQGWTNEDLITKINPSAVVNASLVKSTLFLAGYDTPMEETVSSMLENLKEITTVSQEYNLGSLPKAIYVCKTNVIETDTGSKMDEDNPDCLFNERNAPPIKIWRHLVEKCGINPENIAVYCNLKFSSKYPRPKDFILFSGGKKDYKDFSQGNFQHIIFNLGLQEGWDDPLVYCAYIDKFMKSKVAIEQVIGRLLRQPNITHYPQKELNTAHFYIRVDKQEVFQEVIKEVDKNLQEDSPELEVKISFNQKPEIVPPKANYYVPKIILKLDQASQKSQEIINEINDYREDKINTKSKGKRTITWRDLGNEENNSEIWTEEFAETNQITARVVFKREIIRSFPAALNIITTEDKKFDALVGFGSRAYKHLAEKAKEIISTYVNEVELKQSETQTYLVPPISLYDKKYLFFPNSLHGKYSGLNELEKEFVKEVEKFNFPWCRNPSRSGYGIPLLTEGSSKTFYPDFLVWKGNKVIAIDTTGEHLLGDKLARKLLNIPFSYNTKQRLIICLISQGQYNSDLKKLTEDGWTLWGLKENRELSLKHRNNLAELIKLMLEI